MIRKDILLFIKAMYDLQLVRTGKELEDLTKAYEYLKEFDFDFEALLIGNELEFEDISFDYFLTDLLHCGISIGTTKEILAKATKKATYKNSLTKFKLFVQMTEYGYNVSFEDSRKNINAVCDLLCDLPFVELVRTYTIICNDFETSKAYLINHIKNDLFLINCKNICNAWNRINNGNALTFEQIEKEVSINNINDYFVEFINNFDNNADSLNDFEDFIKSLQLTFY